MAALGDGIVAAKGALADNLADMNVEYKGVSFATGNLTYTLADYDPYWNIKKLGRSCLHVLFSILGGDYDWRKKLTLPNILKEFNSRLKGMSKGKIWLQFALR